MSWNPWFGILLAGTTLIDWFVAIQIENSKYKVAAVRLDYDLKNETAIAVRNSRTGKGWLLVSIFSNLGCLAGFKYFAFLYNTFSFAKSLTNGTSPHYIEAFVIPIGLSFYTFHSLGYVIDVYRRKIEAEKNLGIFALFVSFFPQLVAGPIARFHDLGVQFQTQKIFRHENLVIGTRLALWGFFKKIVIADRLAEIVNPVFQHPENFGALSLLIVSFFFVIQVYCDFSGYSDIAKGVAKYFGYDLMVNFRRPMLSKSIHEFWKRNHISMTSWFRDYVYISLGGNKVSMPRWIFNIFLTFLLSGLWHGASWTFVIWGAMYGIIFIIEIPIMKFTQEKKWLAFPSWIYLIVIHTLIMIAFRAQTSPVMQIFYSKIFSFNYNFHSTFSELKNIADLFPLLLSVAMIAFLFLKELHEEHRWLNRIPNYENHMRPFMYVILFVGLFLLGEFNTNEFIYFHF